MLRWFPKLQVATACFSCSPPDLNLLDPYFIFMYMHASNCKFIKYLRKSCLFCFVFGATAPQWAMASSFFKFVDHTQRRSTVSRTPLDEWSARRRDLYLTTHNTHNRKTSMPPVGFEPTISAGERPQTYALDRATTRTGYTKVVLDYILLHYLMNRKNTKMLCPDIMKGTYRSVIQFCS